MFGPHSRNSRCGRWKARKVSAESGTVVVVEDDPHIADLVDLYLRREGFRVLLARDGEKGLEVLARENPCIVILDVGLPGARDGFDVCRAIRARSAVPVLFLTARDDEMDRVLGLELGADDYLVKPFSPREFGGAGAGHFAADEGGSRPPGGDHRRGAGGGPASS